MKRTLTSRPTMPIYSKKQVGRMGNVPMPKIVPYLFVISLILISVKW